MFTASIDEAHSKMEFFIKLSEVESDEAANIEKLKRTRHSRNVLRNEEIQDKSKKQPSASKSSERPALKEIKNYSFYFM